MFDIVFGFGVSRQAREELAAEAHRRKVDARKDQIATRRVNRQGFAHNVAELLFGDRS